LNLEMTSPGHLFPKFSRENYYWLDAEPSWKAVAELRYLSLQEKRKRKTKERIKTKKKKKDKTAKGKNAKYSLTI